jgi:small GTP-binding protein
VPAEAAAAAAKREGSSGDDGGKTKSSKRVSLRRPRLGKRQGSAEKLAELAEEAAPGAAAAAGAAEKEKGKGSKGKGKKDKGERKSKAKKGKGKGKGKGESDSDTSGVSSSSDTEAVAPGGTDAARGTGASAAEAAEGGAASSSASANAAGAAVEGGAERVAAAASAAASAMIDAKPEKVKLLLLGDSGVGKSSIMSRFAEDTFTEQMLSTAGVDFSAKTLSLDGKKVTVSIWDTAGQERFRKITQAYYRGAHGILLVYDVSDRGSFDNVGFWMENISRATCRTAPAVLIVGNKIDLERAVPTEEGAAAAEKYDVQFFETSAKEGKNVHDAVLECARKALDAKLFGGVPQVQGGGGMPGDARRGKGDKNEKCILM